VTIANAIAPPIAGRVVLLNVMRRPAPGSRGSADAPSALEDSLQVVREALVESLASGHQPDTLVTIADHPWIEIARVAGARKCESLLLGMTSLKDPKHVERLEALLNEVDCDTVIMRARPRWVLTPSMRIVVAVGPTAPHDGLRARLLGSLRRTRERPVHFVRVLPVGTSDSVRESAQRDLQVFAEEETPGAPTSEIIVSDDPLVAIAGCAESGDLLILGLMRHRGGRLFGEHSLQITHRTEATTLLIGHKQAGLGLAARVDKEDRRLLLSGG
jgi:hypothetical protein